MSHTSPTTFLPRNKQEESVVRQSFMHGNIEQFINKLWKLPVTLDLQTIKHNGLVVITVAQWSWIWYFMYACSEVQDPWQIICHCLFYTLENNCVYISSMRSYTTPLTAAFICASCNGVCMQPFNNSALHEWSDFGCFLLWNSVTCVSRTSHHSTFVHYHIEQGSKWSSERS
jgi:hypothetical protein